MPINFGKDEIKELKKILARNPAAQNALEAHALLSELGDSLRYPINSSGELMKQLVGKKLDIGDQPINAEQYIKKVPKFYFPIASKEDFIEKMDEIFSPEGEEESFEKGDEIPIEKAPPFPDALKNIKPPRPIHGLIPVSMREG
jgi:hypothetical protein